jgi:uncharacterized protein (UPF0261 family)
LAVLIDYKERRGVFMKTIAIAGTFDTKGEEYQYIKSLMKAWGAIP